MFMWIKLKSIFLNIKAKNIKDHEDQYGKDVSLSVDTYQPEDKKEVASNVVKDDLPF